MTSFRPSIWTLLKLVCLVVLIAFVVAPLCTLVVDSFRAEDGNFTLSGYNDFFSTPRHVEALRNSLTLGVITTLGALIIGLPVAFVVARYDFPFKNTIAFLPLITFVVPDIIVTQAWLMVLGNNGIITNMLWEQFDIVLPSIYGWTGLSLVMILQHYGYAYLLVLAAFRGVDSSLEEAGRTLGSAPLRVYLTITARLLLPPCLTAALVVFTLAVDNFGVPVIMAPRTPILSVSAYNAYLSEFSGNTMMQSVMSVLLIFIAAFMLFAQKLVVRGRNFQMDSGKAAATQRLTGQHGIWASVILLAVIGLSLLPLSVVILGAFTKSVGPVLHWGQFSLDNFATLGSRGVQALLNSFFLSAIASIAGVIFGALVSYLIIKRRSPLTALLDYCSLLPLAVAGTVLGIGLINTYNNGWIVLSGTWIIMAAAYFVRRVPYAINNTSSALYSMRDNLEEASVSLGVPPARSTVNVILPLLRPAMISSAIFMWVTTLSELSATLVLYTPGLETMPIQIYRQIDGGYMGAASAYSLILIGSIFIPLLVATKIFKIDIFSTRKADAH